ncbi:hypothetical protein BGX33_010032 [Mortierella sp. NVP41]|nr:hypothetical protein BGX33_010032 [Mortierella sp. NVP41]
MDVYIEGQLNQTNASPAAKITPAAAQTPSRSTRNPDYDPMEMANTLLEEFNIPMAPPRGPQTDSDNATGNYTLHDHSIVIQPSVSTTTNNTPHRAPHVSVKNSTGDGTIIIEDMAETMFKAKKGDMKAQVKLGSPT